MNEKTQKNDEIIEYFQKIIINLQKTKWLAIMLGCLVLFNFGIFLVTKIVFIVGGVLIEITFIELATIIFLFMHNMVYRRFMIKKMLKKEVKEPIVDYIDSVIFKVSLASYIFVGLCIALFGFWSFIIILSVLASCFVANDYYSCMINKVKKDLARERRKW